MKKRGMDIVIGVDVQDEVKERSDLKDAAKILVQISNFQMMEKISVKGSDTAPLYKWLSSKDQNGWNNDSPNWNFCKYLIDENGKLLKFYTSSVKPMSEEITKML